MLVPFVVFLCESGIKQTSCSLKILFRLDISYSAKFSRRIFFRCFCGSATTMKMKLCGKNVSGYRYAVPLIHENCCCVMLENTNLRKFDASKIWRYMVYSSEATVRMLVLRLAREREKVTRAIVQANSNQSLLISWILPKEVSVPEGKFMLKFNSQIREQHPHSPCLRASDHSHYGQAR